DHLVERPHGGVRREPQSAHRDALMTVAGALAVTVDLLAVVGAAKAVDHGGLAETGEAVEGHGPFDAVTVLTVTGHDLGQLVVDAGQLRGREGSKVGVPVKPRLAVGGPVSFVQSAELLDGEQLRTTSEGSVHHLEPALLAAEAVAAGRRGGHSTTPMASA